jgi:hypothetical protein
VNEKLARTLKTAGITVLALGAVGATAAFLLRDQMSRHRRDLFSPHALRRLAALGYMAGEPASIDNVTLLRDFIDWERRPLLRSRAEAIVRRMEEEARLRELAGEQVL